MELNENDKYVDVDEAGPAVRVKRSESDVANQNLDTIQIVDTLRSIDMNLCELKELIKILVSNI